VCRGTRHGWNGMLTSVRPRPPHLALEADEEHTDQRPFRIGLDGKGPSSSSTASWSRLDATSSSSNPSQPLSPRSPGAEQFQRDAALALELAKELNSTHSDAGLSGTNAFQAVKDEEAREKRDRQLALALARHQESEAVASTSRANGASGEDGRNRTISLAATVRTTASEAESCPCCEARWTDIGGAVSSAASLQEQEMVEIRRRKHVQKCVEEKAKLAEQLGEEGEDELADWGGEVTGEATGAVSTASWTGGRKGKLEVVGTAGLSSFSLLRNPSLARIRSRPHPVIIPRV
jgi:hypothetical protein